MSVPTPKSNATNAYDLLSDVINVILEESQRLNMGYWLLDDAALTSRGDFLHTNQPACRTVACVGGWTIVLAKGKEHANLIEISREALELLSGTPYPFDSDLAGDLYKLFQTFPENYPSIDALTPGTPAYAEHIADKIRAIQAKWETELKAKAI